MARTKKINGKIKITVTDVDNVDHVKTVNGGAKASSVMGNGQMAIMYPKGEENPYSIDLKVRDPELRDGDTIELQRQSAKVG